MNPWLSADIARQMRENVDRQLAERPWPVHFTALADAVRSVTAACPWANTLTEVGCGVGHGWQIVQGTGVAQYYGVDINAEAIALAADRYPDGIWYNVSAADVPVTVRSDVVADGSCLLHADDWRGHLGHLCGAARDAVILHRIPIAPNLGPTRRWHTFGYGREFPSWEFNLGDVVREMTSHGFTHTETRKADGDSLTLTFRSKR